MVGKIWLYRSLGEQSLAAGNAEIAQTTLRKTN
jgi:hypothetical protein